MRHARRPPHRGRQRDREVLAGVAGAAGARDARGTASSTRWWRAGRWPIRCRSARSHAGDWASSVPDLLVAEGRLGVALGEPVEAARGELEAAVAEVDDADPWLRDHPVEVEWWGGQFASGRLPAGSDLVDRVAGRAPRRHGPAAAADVYGAPYGSDLRLLTGLGGHPDGAVRARRRAARPRSAGIRRRQPRSLATARTLALLALDVCGG